MKRILYIIILVATLIAPGKNSDIAKLQPVELIAIREEANGIIIQTDTGDEGRGINVDEAMENLMRTTPGIVYLDTANYLLIKTGAEEYAKEMGGYLKTTVMLCKTDDDPDLKDAAMYLSVHKPEITYARWEGNEKLPELQITAGKMILEKT